MIDFVWFGLLCLTAYLGFCLAAAHPAIFFTALLLYLGVGFLLLDSPLLWPFSLDIRIAGWLERRRITRETNRQIAELEAERNRNLRMVAFEWTGNGDEAVITITLWDKVSQWRGQGTAWDNDGGQASAWFKSWLHDRWLAAKQGRDQ